MVGTWILGKGEFVKQLIQQSDKRRKVQLAGLSFAMVSYICQPLVLCLVAFMRLNRLNKQSYKLRSCQYEQARDIFEHCRYSVHRNTEDVRQNSREKLLQNGPLLNLLSTYEIVEYGGELFEERWSVSSCLSVLASLGCQVHGTRSCL